MTAETSLKTVVSDYPRNLGVKVLAADEFSVQSLMKLGLTEYEARIYVVLTKMGPRNASEISFLGKVPRPKTYGAIRSLERQGPRQSLQTSTRHDQRSESQRLLHHHRQRTRTSLQGTIGGFGESSSKRSESKGCRTGKPKQRECRKRTGRGNRSPKRYSSNYALRQRRLS